ncbi:MAG: RNA polymerase sigma factor, partial [Myxococcota bacterium]
MRDDEAIDAPHPASPDDVALERDDVDVSIVRFIERGQQGQALGLMMAAYGDRIGRFFARRVQRQEWVDDLTQETFVRAMQGLGGFRGESRVLTWLTRIAYNVMCTAHNHRNRRRVGQARYHAHQTMDAATGPHPDRHLKRFELAQAIDACLERTNTVVRELALLVWVEGYTFVEAAEITNMSEDAVRKRLCRARPLLQRCLELRGVVGNR